MSRVNNKSTAGCQDNDHVGVGLLFGKPCNCMTVEGLRIIASHRGEHVSGTKAEL